MGTWIVTVHTQPVQHCLRFQQLTGKISVTIIKIGPDVLKSDCQYGFHHPTLDMGWNDAAGFEDGEGARRVP